MTGPKQRILGAAERIHREEGVASLSIRRVAELVGLTPMAIYRHYEDKDALVDALVDAGYERWEEYLARAAAAEGALERVRAGLLAYVAFAIEEPRDFELLFLIQRRVPQAPASLRMTASPAFGAMIAAVKEASDAGLLRAGDPGELILLCWAAVHGLVALHFTGRFGYDDDRFRAVAERTTATLLALLAPPTPTSPSTPPSP